jgi:protein-tyrosine kinase
MSYPRRTVMRSLFPLKLLQKNFDGGKSHEKDGKELIFLEQFKALRAKFEYQMEMHEYKVVAVTSAIAEEGKTLTSANLAAQLASVGRKKVLLVDTDMRKSDIATMFDAPQEPGLKEYLSGSASLDKVLLTSNAVKDLFLITGGKRGAAPADMLAGQTFRSFLQDMRNKFDVVLLDTPPILPVADTISLRDQVDKFIFIFRIGFTPYVMLQQAIEEIEKNKIIGVVLNGVDMQKYKYYKRYYGEYYHKKSE